MEDNGAGLAATASFDGGTGLSNLRSRLNLLYGNDQKFEICIRREGGVAVQIEIPVHEAGSNQIGDPQSGHEN